MKAVNTISSQAIPLELDDVDTDMIIPAQFLVKINKEGYGSHLFARMREKDVHFIFNDPCYNKAEILIAKSNFGCGSSREHAVWALMQFGIRVVIAHSFSDIFYNNAAKNGLLLITLNSYQIEDLLNTVKEQAPKICVDLDRQCLFIAEHTMHSFEFDSFYKECFLKGYDELDYLLEATQ